MFAMKPICRRLARAAAALGLAWTVLNAGAHDLRHGRVPPADVGGELDLVDQHGAKFALSRLAGEPVLLFFGFTHCGSTCPIALGNARQVLHTLGPAAPASVVFVTLDPLNDGPEQLRDFVQRIHPRIIGLTGSPAQIERAAEHYGVGIRQVQRQRRAQLDVVPARRPGARAPRLCTQHAGARAGGRPAPPEPDERRTMNPTPSHRGLQRLRHLGIGARLALGFGLVCLLIVVMAANAAWQSSKLQRQFAHALNDGVSVLTRLQALSVDVSDVGLAARDSILASEPAVAQAALERIEAGRGRIGEAIEKLNRQLGDEQKALAEELGNHSSSVLVVLVQLEPPAARAAGRAGEGAAVHATAAEDGCVRQGHRQGPAAATAGAGEAARRVQRPHRDGDLGHGGDGRGGAADLRRARLS